MINYSLKKIRIIKDNKNDLFLIINVIINNLSNNSLCAPWLVLIYMMNEFSWNISFKGMIIFIDKFPFFKSLILNEIFKLNFC